MGKANPRHSKSQFSLALNSIPLLLKNVCRSYFLLLFTLISFAQFPFIALAQGYKPPRILFILDASAQVNDQQYRNAENIILNTMDSIYRINTEAEFALRVYGHLYQIAQNKCDDNQLEVNFSKRNYAQMSLRLGSLQRKGISSAKFALQHSLQQDFASYERYRYVIVLITASISVCDGDICDISTLVENKNLSCEPLIISLNNNNVNWDCVGKCLRGNDSLITQIIDHCRKILDPRDKSYTSTYGMNHLKQDIISINPSSPTRQIDKLIPIAALPINAFQIKTSRIKPKIFGSLLHPAIPTGIGYLKVSENQTGGKITLYYQKLPDTTYNPLQQHKSAYLQNKLIIQLNTGNYRIVYYINAINYTKDFVIKQDMITEIKLQ